MEQAELSQLSNTIRSSMGETAGKFRDAAERGNNNLAKILGTVAAAIKAQRQDLAEMQNVLSESESVSERNASTLQSIQAELQDINSGIHDIATGMKNMARGIANVDNSIFRLNQDLQSSIGQSLLPGLLTGLSGTATSIVKGITAIAMGGLVFGGAKTAMDYVTGSNESMGGGGPATGTFKEKAPMIMQRLQKDFGITKEQSAGVVGSLAAETGGFTKLQEEHPIAGRGGYGWAQWTGPRRKEFEAFAASKGLNPSSDEANYQFLAHELRTSQAGELARLRQAKSAAEASRIFTGSTREGVGFLRPGAEHYGSSQRYAEKAMGIEPNQSQGSSPSGTTPQSSPMQSKFEQPPVSSEGVSRVETIGGEHGHGPISGTKESHGREEQEAGVGKMQPLPGGDLLALGRALQSQGIRVSEHPAFGGVHPEQHHPGSAHNDGLAIDINAPGGITEANDPVWGKKFDELAKQIQAAGYTVLWRTKGHDNHIHAQIGGKGIKGGQSVIGGQTTPSTGPSPTTPGSYTASPMGATTAMTPAMPTVSGGITPEQMAMITGGMNPMAMAATTAMMSQLQSAQDEAAAIAPQQQQESQSPQFDQTQILSQLSKPSENAQIVQQAAVAKQAQQELAQQEPITDLLNSIFGQLGGGSSTVVNNSSNMNAGGYNGQYDIGWPDWAEMIGGNHWKEMKSYKKNMWG